MKDEVLLIKTNDVEIKLCACDDGNIVVSYPDKSYRVLDHNICYIGDRSFLLLSASKDTELTFMMPLKHNEEGITKDFFEYWDEDRLTTLKNKKLESFLDFWRFTLQWVNDSIDIEDVTYQIYPTDYRQYEGSLTLHFDICIGDSFISESGGYDVYFNLNNRLSDAYFDYYDLDDDYIWWNDISVSFKPELYDIDSYN